MALTMLCSVSSVMSNSVTPWTVARQAPLSMGFSQQEYWNWLPCPPPGSLPNPGIKPKSLALQADSLPAEPQGKPSINEATEICTSNKEQDKPSKN